MKNKLKPTIVIKDIPTSDALKERIEEKIKKLETFHPKIMHCDVLVTQIQKHKHQGKLYQVRIHVTIPGQELTTNHSQDEDVYVAVRDSFNAMRRQIIHFLEKQRGAVKHHAIPVTLETE